MAAIASCTMLARQSRAGLLDEIDGVPLALNRARQRLLPGCGNCDLDVVLTAALLAPRSVVPRSQKPGLPIPAAECFEFSSFSPGRQLVLVRSSSFPTLRRRLSIESASPYPFRARAGRGCHRLCGNMVERARRVGICEA